MLFATDRQTLEDLNIFGKHEGDSIYNSFNRCATRGGAAILEEMFRYPLSDNTEINRRSEIIRFFAGIGAAFPFQSAHFDVVEPYLANTDERTKLTGREQPLVQKLGNMIAPDTETQQIYKGVQHLVELLKEVQTFVDSLPLPEGHAYHADHATIRTMLQNPAFAPMLQSKGRLTHPDIAAFDVVLRFLYRDVITRLLRQLYYVDVYLSVAKVAADRGFVFPQALPRGQVMVQLIGVYHPHVKNAIPNNMYVTPDGNVLFLTGANMAGKSTFMKSFSIAMYLAHMGFPVAAKEMTFSVLDGIYTTINLPDNLGMGASHFYAEVLRVKKIAQELNSGKHLFILFDELFRGTNVKDAYEATVAITEAFAEKTSSLFVISTHIIEAAGVLRESCSNVRFFYLPTKMNGNYPVYSYTLTAGVTDDRHGMVIIHNEGILDILEAGIQK
jgi:DNA mismatch repair ATPase MutS